MRVAGAEEALFAKPLDGLVNPFAAKLAEIESAIEPGVIPKAGPKDPELMERFMATTGKRVAREIVSKQGDLALRRYLHRHLGEIKVDNPLFQTLESKVKQLASEAVPYNKLLGIRQTAYKVGEEHYFKHYREVFFSEEGRTAWQKALKKNFGSFHIERVSFRDYLEKTFFKGNVLSILAPIVKGELVTALARSSIAVLAIVPVLQEALQAYREAKQQEESNPLTIARKVAQAVALHGIKAFLSWEMGTLGFIVGSALLPFGATATAGGILGMAAFSSVTYWMLSKILKKGKSSGGLTSAAFTPLTNQDAS